MFQCATFTIQDYTVNLGRRPNIWDCLLKSRNGSRAIVAKAVVTSGLINWCTEKRTEHLPGAYCWYWCSYHPTRQVFTILHKINSDAAIWVALGTGRNFKYLQINAISRSLGEEKSLAMPYFHSCTGCDTTSSFFRKGKKTAWEAWKSYPDVTTAFATIALDPFLDFNRQSQIFGLLPRFTLVL